MTNLIYDGSWDGLLSAVFLAFPRKGFTIGKTATLYKNIDVETDTAKSERLSRGIARLDKSLPTKLYTAFLAERPGFEDDLLGTLRLGFEMNADPLSQLQYTFVGNVNAAYTRATKEAQKFTGIARFVRVHSDLYAGDIEPDCNILPLIGGHFHDRFGNQRLILRDRRRLLAVVSDNRGWWLVALQEPLEPLPEGDAFANWWHSYFRAIAIPERANPKLQQKYVPLKYRKFLPEFE